MQAARRTGPQGCGRTRAFQAEPVAALGRRRYDAEYAAGAGLTADAVLAELAAAMGS
ncbi:hypothetical protein [Streptomyces himalayensis]|uniref:Uncharacterized protein n=1 Tax=Streptomyces himalayensis subsp. himalayensis TaxID=2756131 RepID=A0A7W0DRU2_9ACTN|nr:hypothetical protein [Streptomyces himalayensis]MBA2950026.1 hypothetical protein [Streptomyces himalayensis subsp. himalayensis]